MRVEHSRTAAIMISVILAGAWAAQATASSEPRVLFDFEAGFDNRAAETSDAKAAVTPGGALRVETGHQAQWPGVTLKAPEGRWDLSQYEYVSLDVTNRSGKKLTLSCRVDNPGANGTDRCVTDQVSVDPGGSQTLTVRIFPVPWKLDKHVELVGMRANPVHAGKIDTANVTQLLVFLTKPAQDYVFEIDNVRAGGHVQVLDSSTFLPFIDEFGQFIHKDWPGKTHATEEMIAAGRDEEKDLKAHTRPQDWNKYGGWADGPRLKATGFFRVQKHRGRWWLVDPTGRLFWSHGIDCVRSADATPEHNYQ